MIRVKMTARSWMFEDRHRFCVFFFFFFFVRKSHTVCHGRYNDQVSWGRDSWLIIS